MLNKTNIFYWQPFFTIFNENVNSRASFLAEKSLKSYQIKNIAFLRAFPNQRINLQKEKVIQMY